MTGVRGFFGYSGFLSINISFKSGNFCEWKSELNIFEKTIKSSTNGMFFKSYIQPFFKGMQ